MVRMKRVQSSAIDAIGYDEHAQELHVRFIDSGKTYIYRGVPSHVFDDFLAAASHGHFFGKFIRPVFADYVEKRD
jgi:hypothetical protein